MLKVAKKEVLEKLVRDNALHKALAKSFGYSERRIEQWFYRASTDYNPFSKIYNHYVVKEVCNHLKINEEEFFTQD